MKRRTNTRDNETTLVYSCLDYLNKIAIVSWRNNTGAIVKDGKHIKFGQKGAPDIFGIIWPRGTFLAIECKRTLKDVLTILNFNGGAVRIGIDAPKEVKIKRGQCHAPAGSLEITTERK